MLEAQSFLDLDDETRSLFWEESHLRKAYERIILESGLPVTSTSFSTEPEQDPFRMLHWIHRAPRTMGLDVVEERVSLHELLYRVTEISGAAFLAILVAEGMFFVPALFEGNQVRVFRRDGSEVSMRRTAFHGAVARFMAASNRSLARIFEGLPDGRETLERVLREGAHGGVPPWLFRFEVDAANSIARQIDAADAWGALGLHVFLSIIQVAAALGALWTLGNSAIDGRIDFGRVMAWSLLALSDVPLQYMASQALLRFSLAMTTSVKKRLLEGAFFANEKEVRAKGFGELLARTNESNIIEQLNLSEASGAISSVLLVIGAVVLFARGAQPAALIVMLGVFVTLSVLVIRASWRAYRALFVGRIGLTDDLADKIIGHRTRAIQQAAQLRHTSEDLELSAYARSAVTYDRLRAISSLMPRAWLLVSCCGLLAAFLLRAPLGPMVFSGIGILLAFRGFDGVFQAVERIVQWYSAWKGVDMLFTAGRQRERASRALDLDVDESNLPTAVTVSSVSFSHRVGGRPVLADANVSIRAGEKILLEGGSGSGKTTVLKLIAGELPATAGVILVGGTDRFSVSEQEWRRRVASAPQFHENYVFSNTLAFNLDPGGRPDAVSDDAAEICEELGLGPLVGRMPQGYAQILGETGWQLSHGERSRIFIARALLQKSDVFLFDENFGSLDPETLIQALECVRRRARTLIVVAHT